MALARGGQYRRNVDARALLRTVRYSVAAAVALAFYVIVNNPITSHSRAFVSDAGEGKGPGVAELEAAGIAHEIGGHQPDGWDDTTVVIKSPGIPDNAPVVQTCRDQGNFCKNYWPQGKSSPLRHPPNGLSKTNQPFKHKFLIKKLIKVLFELHKHYLRFEKNPTQWRLLFVK